MSRTARRLLLALAVLAALIVMAVVVRLDRRDASRRVEPADTTSAGLRVPGEVPPPQPTGPQVATSDSAMRALAPRLEEWAAMWRHALPGFRIDSLHIAEVRPAFKSGVVQPLNQLEPLPGLDAARPVLEAESPDGHHRLVFDQYQSVTESESGIEIGGEPDSAPLLLDLRADASNRFEFCGTPCGFHWGLWLDNDRFALGGWQDADETGRWKQGNLAVYSLADSTAMLYVTRIVAAQDYARYRRAWEEWVSARYRAIGARRRA